MHCLPGPPPCGHVDFPMSARWTFFAFDEARFRTLETALRRACETGDFTAAAFEEAAGLLESLEEDSRPEEVCNALLVELCGTGEAVVFETGLPELILHLRRQPEGEKAADLLGVLVSAEPNVEEWFRAESGLVGRLTTAQTQELRACAAALRSRERSSRSSRGLTAWTRRFVPMEPADDQWDRLLALIDEAVSRRCGLALLRE